MSQDKILFELHNEACFKNFSILDTYNVIKKLANNNCLDKPYLNVLSWNIHCLNNKKLNTIKHYLDEWSRNSILGSCEKKFPISCSGDRKNYFIDILCFTETWLRDDKKFNY